MHPGAESRRRYLERVADHVGIMDRGRMVVAGRLEDLQTGMRRVQIIFGGQQVPEGFCVPGALRSRAEGPVLTAVVRIDSESQLESLRAIPGTRVADFPLGLQDIFIELLDRPLTDPPLVFPGNAEPRLGASDVRAAQGAGVSRVSE